MQILLTESFQRDIAALSDAQKAQIFSVILQLPIVLKEPMNHSGLGLRKIHSSGIFEARIGLGLRLVFGQERNAVYLHHIGNHDEIRRYLKGL